jgi:hypothetical protein
MGCLRPTLSLRPALIIERFAKVIHWRHTTPPCPALIAAICEVTGIGSAALPWVVTWMQRRSLAASKLGYHIARLEK